MENSKKTHVFAAVRSNEEFLFALTCEVETIFMLCADIDHIFGQVKLAHQKGKKVFVHIDLAEGIGKDAYGVKYLKKQGVDGIISTKTSMIKFAKKEGLVTVQRFFIVDSKSIDTTMDAIAQSKADMIEIMPGLLYKVIGDLKNKLNTPIVAGGLIQEKEEVEKAILSGAYAVSTGKSSLWT